MTRRTIEIRRLLLLTALCWAVAAPAQLPKNLDDDFITENTATTLQSKDPRRTGQPSPITTLPALVIPKTDAIDALDTERLMKMAGQIVTVQGVIVSTHHSEKTNTRFFNFDKKREKFGFVIFSSAAKNFEQLGEPTEFYLNKKVQVTGVLTIYRGKPSMTVSKPEQILVLR
jgi:hypothetical protein